MTVQYDAKLSFDLSLPADDGELIRLQTPLSVVIEHTDGDDECSAYALKLRVGEGDDAEDYLQTKFVHRSAADGAANCLLQYLQSKPKLNVIPTIVSAPTRPLPPEKQTFVPVGWSIAKVESSHIVSSSRCVKVAARPMGY